MRGDAIPVKGGYRGGALNLAARLCSIAGPGENLASETVIGLARKTEGIAFVDRGEVTLKGLAAPVRVLQIAPEGELPATLPPLQPILVTHPTNLPDEPTPFIGRDAQIDEVTQLLRIPRIRPVTLTGPGGTGKTRLALQAGNTLLHDVSDGLFFVREIDKIAYVFDALACLSAAAEDYTRAAHLLASAATLWTTVEVEGFRKTVEVAFPQDDEKLRSECEAAARAHLGSGWEVVRQAAAAMSLHELAVYVLDES